MTATTNQKKPSHFHALLAVEPELKGKAEKITNEAIKTFTGKQAFFKSKHRTYKPRYDDGYQYPPEAQEMVTTVAAKLEYVQEHLTKTIDALFQKEHTNVVAKADLKIGETVLTDVPATALLNLENRLKEIRKLYRSIPCLPPGQLWNKDLDTPNVYRAAPVTTVKTKKTTVPIVLSPATKEHPAQIKSVDEDIPIGEWEAIEREGSWTALEKSQKLGRIDELIETVKTARQEANSVNVVKAHVGKVLFDYINGPVVH